MVARTDPLDVGHVVQFYGHEEELADQVAGYLLAALQGGGVAVVIATIINSIKSCPPYVICIVDLV